MPWQQDEWDAFCLLVDEGWPGKFDGAAREAWRALLDDHEPKVVVTAMKALMLRGLRFRPSVSELLAAARADPSQPTFDEMLQLVFFGPRAVLRAEPTQRTWGSPAEGKRLRDAAALERAETLHPLVASFVARQGVDRLRSLPLDDPDFGGIRLKELRQAWEQHTEACEGREIAALAAGGSGGELRKLDPLAAIRKQIPEGVSS